MYACKCGAQFNMHLGLYVAFLRECERSKRKIHSGSTSVSFAMRSGCSVSVVFFSFSLVCVWVVFSLSYTVFRIYVFLQFTMCVPVVYLFLSLQCSGCMVFPYVFYVLGFLFFPSVNTCSCCNFSLSLIHVPVAVYFSFLIYNLEDFFSRYVSVQCEFPFISFFFCVLYQILFRIFV